MKKSIILIVLFGICLPKLSAQTHAEEISAFQQEMNDQFLNSEKSPLTEKQQKNFKGHDFFPINAKYRVVAKFEKVDDVLPFLMRTTTSRLPEYRVFGEASFQIDGKEFTVPIYQSIEISEGYEDYLFFPFTDLSNANETYAGGRYIDLNIPEGETIVIDFNKSYNPYCAYNGGYSCPIPPKENNLDISIKAGTKYNPDNFKH